MVDFSLQLHKLDFAHVGSLTRESVRGNGRLATTVRSRPLTKKLHDFDLGGGVDVLGPRDQVFESTAEYFHHVIDRDLEHLHKQLNSVDDEHDARDKYIYFNVMKKLIPRHVLQDYNQGPFKLMCDDFQPTNMIVDDEHNLKVVAVLDWEWSYTAPMQLVNSTPSWLLIESPHTWPSVDERLVRYNKHLELYARILEEEEAKIPWEDTDQKPSTFLRASQKEGRQWFHLLVLRGFNGPTCVPFLKLREETKDWDELAAAILELDIDAFLQRKMADLERYRTQLAEIEGRYKTVLRGSQEDLRMFLRENSGVLSLDKRRYEWQSWACFEP